MQQKIKLLSNRVLSVLFAVVLVTAYYPNIVSAAQITNRKVAIGSSLASVDTSYGFTFTLASSSVIKSVSFTPCQSPSGACVPVAGFSGATSTLASQPTNIGDASGWLSAGNGTSLRIAKTGNTAAPTAATPTTVNFLNVHNPSAANATFYMRIATFSNDDYTGAIDNGVVATSTAGQVAVSVVINEKLTFTLASANITLTEPTTTSTGTGSSSMTVSTNATSGYSINYSGATLTSGIDTITAMGTQAVSAVNTKQFGLNLMSNTTPVIGSAVSGIGSGVPASGYDIQNQFKFNTAGDTIATAAASTNDNTFTTSYIVNMNGSTASGAYSTILTYVATANF